MRTKKLGWWRGDVTRIRMLWKSAAFSESDPELFWVRKENRNYKKKLERLQKKKRTHLEWSNFYGSMHKRHVLTTLYAACDGGLKTWRFNNKISGRSQNTKQMQKKTVLNEVFIHRLTFRKFYLNRARTEGTLHPTHTCLHVSTDVYTHVYTHACTHVYTHAYTHVYTHACMFAPGVRRRDDPEMVLCVTRRSKGCPPPESPKLVRQQKKRYWRRSEHTSVNILKNLELGKPSHGFGRFFKS